MKNFIRVSVITIFLFAATILICITAALSLSFWLYPASAVIFLIFNIVPLSGHELDRKLKNAAFGADLLCSFLALFILDSAFVIFSLTMYFDIFSKVVWIELITAVLTLLIIFWNGIIRVYLFAAMIGVRWRIIGIICGMIPVVNIIVLVKIISMTRKEVAMAERRNKRNSEYSGRNICKTKYPILLVHGVFFRDSDKFNYWGRIPAELEKNGAVLYYGEQQSALGIKESGAEIAKKIEEIVSKTDCEKVNIIAHSKGGLDCRYAISCLGAEKYTASLTTINTPHRGCVFAEWLLDNMPKSFQSKVADKYNVALKLIGDSTPDFLKAVGDLKASECEKFNKNVPDSDDVYYQSVGSKINKAMAGVFPLNFSYMFAKYFDGPNDGLVTVNSAKWGEKFIYIDSDSPDGVSHADVIDLFRHDKPDFDIREFYVNLVSDLREKGL